MKKLFWGFLFIYLNFNLNFNEHTLNVFPDFVGYYLLLKGTQELDGESGLFQGVRPFALGMMVYTAVLWVGELLAIRGDGAIATGLSLASAAVSLYISWVLTQGVLDVERQRDADLNGTVLYGRWKALLIITVVNYLLTLLANLANLSVVLTLATLTVLAALIVIIMFLLAWNRCATAYENLATRRGTGTGPMEDEPKE